LLSLPLNLFALDQDAAFKAMKDEMARNKQKLYMPGFAKPFFITYTLEDNNKVDIMASLGALIKDEQESGRMAYVNMRAGTPEFDNTAFGDPRPAARYAADGYYGVRSPLWLASDAAYLDALEFLSKKKAFKQQRNIIDVMPDFSKAPVVNLREPKNEEIFDRAYFADAARQMSAAGKDFPKLKKFIVTISYLNNQKYYIDSPGSSYYNNTVTIAVESGAALQTKDGFDIEETSRAVYASVKDVPPAEELVKKARAFAAEISALYDAKKAESYIGPVWLENRNAAVFLDRLFGSKIANTKPFWQEKDEDDDGAGYLTKMLGLRVISNALDVYNDPSAREFKGKTLAGFYRLDDEGVEGKKVNLASRGKLVGLLSARGLVKGQKSSYGHARGSAWYAPREEASNLFFIPQHTSADMKKALIDECKRLEMEYCLKLNSFDDASTSGYKIYTADGREEPFYGLDTSSWETRSLRDIVAAGDDTAAYNFTRKYRPPSSLITPSLIVTEMTFKPATKKPSRPPMVPKP